MSKKVLLYSGGTDSWLIKELWSPDVLLYVDMGGMYSKEEIEHIKQTLDPEDLEKFEVVNLPLGQWEDKNTAFIPARNMYLLMVAANYGDNLCLGATAEDAGGSSDKDIAFLEQAESLLKRLYAPQSLYKGKKVVVETTFTYYTKEDLLQMYLERGGSIDKFKEKTFSCYHPRKGKECLNCKACFRKFVVAYGNGAMYSEEEKLRMYAFIEKNVIHRSKHATGRYFLDKENGEEVLSVITDLYKELNKKLCLE